MVVKSSKKDNAIISNICTMSKLWNKAKNYFACKINYQAWAGKKKFNAETGRHELLAKAYEWCFFSNW